MLITNVRILIVRHLLKTSLNVSPLSLVFNLHTTPVCAHGYYPNCNRKKNVTVTDLTTECLKRHHKIRLHFQICLQPAAFEQVKTRQTHREKILLLQFGRAVKGTTHTFKKHKFQLRHKSGHKDFFFDRHSEAVSKTGNPKFCICNFQS